MSTTASETAILLFNKLKAFHDDKDFVLGVMCNAPDDEDMHAHHDQLYGQWRGCYR